MARPTGPKHFIVRHDLKSLMALLGYIWNWEDAQDHLPRGYNRVEVRDRWISFAYTTSDRQERQLRQVTGFYECDEKASHQNIPRQGLLAADGHEQAWLIKGIPYREQPPGPVGVRPINEMLGRFTRDTIVDISEHEFERIRLETLTNWLDPEKIPLWGREPENEQEVLAAVVYAHKLLGIDKMVRLRTAFPDLLVQFEGCSDMVHLELEVYSGGFFSHGHHKHVSNHRFVEDNKPVAVLCWIDNKTEVKNHVPVYELRSLLRENRKIVWTCPPERGKRNTFDIDRIGKVD